MKLYRVNCEINFDMLIAAETPEDAEQIADDSWHTEIDNNEPNYGIPQEITSEDQVPEKWKNGIVYQKWDCDDELTASEFLAIADDQEAEAKAKRPIPGQKELPL